MAPFPRSRQHCVMACTVVVLAACGTDRPPGDDSVGTSCDVSLGDAGDRARPADAAGDVAARGPLDEPECPLGQSFFPDGHGGGTCTPVGPQAYWDLLYDGTAPWESVGLPAPPTEDEAWACPAGSVATFGMAEGTGNCLEVGPGGCDPLFIDDGGVCSPTMQLCPPGSIPVFGTDYEQRAGSSSVSPCLDLDVDPDTGVSCGEGLWGGLVEAPGDVHVLSGATLDQADGSRQGPWPSIALAMAYVESGGRLVLGKGHYDEGLDIKKHLTVVGACSSEVNIAGTVSTPAGPVAVRVGVGLQVALRGLEISGDGVGLVALQGTRVVLERIVVRDTRSAGILAIGHGTEIVAHGVLIESVQPDDDDVGVGVAVDEGARVVLSSAALRGNHSGGVVAHGADAVLSATGLLVESTGAPGQHAAALAFFDGAHATLTQVALRDNHGSGLVVVGASTDALATGLVLEGRPEPGDGRVAMGVVVANAGRAVLTGAVVRRAEVRGLEVSGTGTSLEAVGLLIEDTADEAASLRDGALVALGGSLALTSATLRNTGDRGLVAQGEGSQVQATGLALLATASDRPAQGVGLIVMDGARATIARSVVYGSSSAGLTVAHPGSQLEATGVTISGTVPADDNLGYGVVVTDAGAASLASVAIVGVRGFGVVAEEHQSLLTTLGLLVDATEPVHDGRAGWGIGITRGASATLVATALVGNHEFGLSVISSGTEVTAEGLLVSGTQPNSAGSFGRGVDVVTGARVSLTTAVVEAAHEAGLFAHGGGTEVIAAGLDVRSTRAREPDQRFGYGMLVQSGARLELSSTVLRDNRSGSVVVDDATISMTDTLLLDTQSGDGAVATGAGDGLRTSGSLVHASGVMARSAARAGFLFHQSGGEVSGLVSMDNEYSVVLQGGAHRGEPYELVLVDEPVSIGDVHGAQGPITDTELSIQDVEFDVPVPPESLTGL